VQGKYTVRIPLDYYRILGLPIQATAEQLQQAYRDRALQLPRREYSELAIAARKQLLDEAYAALSDPEQRAAYDATFLSNNGDRSFASGQPSDQQVESRNGGAEVPGEADADPYTPTLDIQPDQFVGALLILHELGEYELLLKQSRPYLSSGSASVTLDKGRLGDPHLVRPDIVLTVAIACLELGREQWQQGQYENAAISLETGQELLLREGLFAALRGEIQADLYKLRPYRILELLALPENNVNERRSGLQLLQDMLQERGGIDGTGNDESGLTIDDFLRFIQQLRGYLTSSEQQVLFEAESKRPSAVATYLAVYALLARGFAQRQPALIRDAKQMLTRLGRRQDVHLEQAVCALLLGQTEEASRALELSQEYEPLAFIREHSQGAPDLLPGLCLYGERWLQAEVFPHFRDLAKQRASLKDYFADDQVQAYLENMSESSTDSADWAAANREPLQARMPSSPAAPRQTDNAAPRSSGLPVSAVRQMTQADAFTQPSGNTDIGQRNQTQRLQQVARSETLAPRTQGISTATLAPPRDLAPTAPVQTLAPAERISTSNQPASDAKSTGLSNDSSSKRQQRQPTLKERAQGIPTGSLRDRNSVPSSASSATSEGLPRLPASRTQRNSPNFGDPKSRRLILAIVAGILGVAIVGFLAIAAFGWIQKTLKGLSGPQLQGNQLLIQLDRPPITIPSPESQPEVITGPLTTESSEQLIETWLSTKAQALGPDHAVDKLEQILAQPALSRWQRKAQADKKNNGYWQYKHSVEIKSVDPSKSNPEQAKVEAVVNEAAEFYQEGKLNKSSSYDDNLRVRYDLVRKDGQWRIRDMAVLK
jgi:hypothetical protein